MGIDNTFKRTEGSGLLDSRTILQKFEFSGNTRRAIESFGISVRDKREVSNYIQRQCVRGLLYQHARGASNGIVAYCKGNMVRSARTRYNIKSTTLERSSKCPSRYVEPSQLQVRMEYPAEYLRLFECSVGTSHARQICYYGNHQVQKVQQP